MTITVGRRYRNTYSSPGGTTTFWTTVASHDVGSAANRSAGAIAFWSASNRGDPTGFEVGTDALTQIGSGFTHSGGGRFAFFRGPLTVTGSQNLRAQFTAITDFDSGYCGYLFWVVEATGAITISGDLALAQHLFGGGGGTIARDVTSATDSLVILASCDISEVNATVTGTGGTTLVTGSNGDGCIGYIAGASTVQPQINYASFSQGVSVAYSVAEAAGGGSAVGAGAHYYAQQRRR